MTNEGIVIFDEFVNFKDVVKNEIFVVYFSKGDSEMSQTPDSATIPMGRVARRRHLQQQNILKIALALFGEKGIEGGGLHEIAARADVAVGTLYSFYPSREALIEALDADLLGTYRSWIVAQTAALADPLARIAARLQLALHFACRNPQWRAFMLRNGLWLAQRGAWPSPLMSADVADAQACGQLHTNGDFAAVTIVGLLYGHLLRIQCRTRDAAFAESAAIHLLHCLGANDNAARKAAAAAMAIEPAALPDILTPLA